MIPYWLTALRSGLRLVSASADARRLNIVLTPVGHRYAAAVTEVILALSAELADRLVRPPTGSTATGPGR